MTESFKTLIDKSKDYLETQIELTKLKTINKSADILSTVVVMVSMILMGFLFLLFISIATAILVGHVLGATHYGFYIVGGFYGIILLIIYVQRGKWIKAPIANGLINKMLK